jgi:hypothetical protein
MSLVTTRVLFDGIVVPLMVPDAKFPEASRATIVDAVLELVALLVTVNVEFPLWFAVKEALPDNPVPETARVKVPSLAPPTSVVRARVPEVAGIVRVVVPDTALGFNTAVPEVEP